MHYVDHEEDEKIPKGKAMIWMANNGYVGTNNGWPLAGQPALFPRSQAIAITTACNLMNFLGEEEVRNLFPNPDGVEDEFWQWLFNDQSHSHDK